MRRSDPIRVPRAAATRVVTTKKPRLGLLAIVALAVIIGVTGAVRAAGADAKSFAAAQLFLQAMDDVPLMMGLAERPAAGVVFETAAGRIVEAEAVSRSDADLTAGRVMGFYGATLAALGWRSLGRGRFAREGEILSISTSAADKGLRVRFSLRPK